MYKIKKISFVGLMLSIFMFSSIIRPINSYALIGVGVSIFGGGAGVPLIIAGGSMASAGLVGVGSGAVWALKKPSAVSGKAEKKPAITPIELIAGSFLFGLIGVVILEDQDNFVQLEYTKIEPALAKTLNTTEKSIKRYNKRLPEINAMVESAVNELKGLKTVTMQDSKNIWDLKKSMIPADVFDVFAKVNSQMVEIKPAQ